MTASSAGYLWFFWPFLQFDTGGFNPHEKQRATADGFFSSKTRAANYFNGCELDAGDERYVGP